MDKKKKIIIACCVVIVLCVAAIIARFAYARFVETVQQQGVTSAQIASMVCEMDVEAVPSSKDVSVISPYCNITVRNYKDNQNGTRQVTETDERFTLRMSPKENFEVPGYYWVEVTNNAETIIARNVDNVTGSFNKDTEQEKHYKIVFQNLGDTDDLTKLVNFNLVAEQVEPE